MGDRGGMRIGNRSRGCGCRNCLEHTQKRDTAKHWFNSVNQDFKKFIRNEVADLDQKDKE